MERMTSNVSEVPSSAVSMGSEIAFMQDCSGEVYKNKLASSKMRKLKS